MDELIRDLEQFGDLTGAFTLMDVAIVLFLSFALSVFVGYVYRYTHRGVSYSQSYVHTLVIMGCVIAVIMLIIGSNIARAFALVGALSIVRFRNAMKETRDIGFIFMAMAIGMAVGTRFYLLAIFSSVALCAFTVVLYKLNMFKKIVRERILRVQLPVDRNHEEALEEPFPANPGCPGSAVRRRAPAGHLLRGAQEKGHSARADRSDSQEKRQPEGHADSRSAGN